MVENSQLDSIDLDTIDHINSEPSMRNFNQEKLKQFIELQAGNVQGHILLPNRNLYQAFLLIRFNGRKAQWMELIRELAEGLKTPQGSIPRICTLQDQLNPKDAVAGEPATECNFLMTAKGYEFLGLDPSGFLDASFRRGMASDQVRMRLGDIPRESWESTYADDWHALLLLSGNSPASLEKAIEGFLNTLIGRSLTEVKEVSGSPRNGLPPPYKESPNLAKSWPPNPAKSWPGFGPVGPENKHFPDLALELGNCLDEEGKPIPPGTGNPIKYEAFGFRDGISQPIFLMDHWERVAPKFYGVKDGENSGLKPGADPRSPLNLVLVRDPLDTTEGGGFGSYFVFRKLEQDVEGYHAKRESLKQELRHRLLYLDGLYKSKPGQESPYREIVDKQIQPEDFIDYAHIGRNKAGNPIDKIPPASHGHPNDNFDYVATASGENTGVSKCPFSAHALRANPRSYTGNLADVRKRKIARRSIPYGSRKGEKEDRRYSEAGLLFFCAQASIFEQFEHIQSHWLNGYDETEDLPLPGFDALAGQRVGPYGVYPPESRLDHAYFEKVQKDRAVRERWIHETVQLSVSFAEFVRLRGGDYFFAPSLNALKHLGRHPAGSSTGT